jgi:hypothetical protein
MSGQPGGGQNQNEQGSQQQGGQPQGGQPQGGQPQVGQPQGGQPQGGQPQGQPTGGQPHEGQYGGTQMSSVDTALMQSWAIYSAILFAFAGFGIGLFFFLADVIDSQLLQLSGAGGSGSGGFLSAGLSSALLLFAPLMAIFLAAFVGVAIARDVDLDDNTTFQVTAVLMGVGTLVSFILSAFLISTLYDNLSLAFGGLIINAILAAIVAAGIGVGGVWTERNQAPQ